jgi:hypothetical protein
MSANPPITPTPLNYKPRGDVDLIFERVAAVVDYARAKPSLTARDLMREFQISDRTANRYMAALARLGIIQRTTLSRTEANNARPPKRMLSIVRDAAGLAEAHHAAVIRNQEAPLPKIPRIQVGRVCVCGMPKSSHPTKSCREFFEKGC